MRTEGWRYIRYANGGEELYDETADPLEYTNLAGHSEHQARKAELAKLLPAENVKDLPSEKGEKKAAARKAKAAQI